jgi:hypothetical protein
VAYDRKAPVFGRGFLCSCDGLKLVAVVVGLVGAFDWNAQVVGLFG